MKIVLILSALVAYTVASPVIDPIPRTIQDADQLIEKAAQDAEHHATKAKTVLTTIQHLETGPRTKEILNAIYEHAHDLYTEYQLVQAAEIRALHACNYKDKIAQQTGMSVPYHGFNPAVIHIVKARQKASLDYSSALKTYRTFVIKVEAYERRQAEKEALDRQQELVRQERERLQALEQERDRYRKSFRGRLARFFGFDRDATEADADGQSRNPSTVEPAHPKSVITIMKENPGRTAIGAAIGLAALASIYALIFRRRNRSIANATLTANSTAVPSTISAPINATKSL